jgi:tetratricopeptide (TPR) repeat protein
MTAAALAICPPDADIAAASVARQLRAGLEYYAAGKIDAAIAAYQNGLAVAGNEAPGSISVEAIAELHSHLGNACMVRGDLEQAAANYKAALRLKPQLTSCWCNLGNVHLKTGKPKDSIALYLHALSLHPAIGRRAPIWSRP